MCATRRRVVEFVLGRGTEGGGYLGQGQGGDQSWQQDMVRWSLPLGEGQRVVVTLGRNQGLSQPNFPRSCMGSGDVSNIPSSNLV